MRGYYIPPTLVVNPDAGLRLTREEVFGPVVNLVRVADGEVDAAPGLTFWPGSQLYRSHADGFFGLETATGAGVWNWRQSGYDC